PYVGGESAIDGAGKVIKLSSNEGALGPSPAAAASYAEIAQAIHRYPDGDCAELRRAIAEVHGLDAARIVCGSGSDELISLLCQAYAGPGDEVLYSRHGFLMYPISAKAAGATPVTAPETDLTADADALLAAVTERTRIVFLANPNNPTGTYIRTDELARLHAGLADDVLLVIDAAYAEYVERADYDAGAGLVEAHGNVVMTRTFSKIYGMGGMRLGWAYGPPEVIDVLHRVRGPFNVNAAAQAAGAAAVRDLAFTDKVRRHNAQWLPWTRDQLLTMGLSVTDSVGNFVLVCFQGLAEKTAEGADAFLKQNGIIVRRMAGYGLPECLRITIGTEDEMRAVVDTLARYLGRNE
ncbi:MAG: histidinol-phosphate transaminase, partial [Rhodospirillaceae bacterium]